MGELHAFLSNKEIKGYIMYFFFTISCHRPSPFSSLHHHLHSKLMFVFLRSLIPKPPFFFNLQISVHFTKCYFFLKLHPLAKKKNLFLITSIYFKIVSGSMYKDMLYKEMLLRQAFKRVGLPPRERVPPFQPSNLLLIFSTRGI